MSNKITVKYICKQDSEITVEKECLRCKTWVAIHGSKFDYCWYCKGTGKIIQKHIVPNNGWLPLEYWIKKFRED